VGAAKPVEALVLPDLVVVALAPAPEVAVPVALENLDSAEVRTDEARLLALERAELATDSALLKREDSAERAEAAKEPVVREAKEEARLASTLLREA
jgi:hypothetical protein